MSNEILTKLMDPLDEEPIDLLKVVRTDEFGNGSLRERELCTWAAKWYLDEYLENWSCYEDRGHTPKELVDIFLEEDITKNFVTNQMNDCINMLEATGVDGYYDHIKADATRPFIDIVRGELEKFLVKRVDSVMTKIQEIFAVRNEQAINEIGMLMNPLVKGYDVDVSQLIGLDGFGDKEQKDELCTLAAKWYLDASGGDRTEETEVIPAIGDLKGILADQNAHEIYVFKTADWKKAIGALGADCVPVRCLFFDQEGVWDIIVSVQNMVWSYFQDHVWDIREKITQIVNARNSA